MRAVVDCALDLAQIGQLTTDITLIKIGIIDLQLLLELPPTAHVELL